VGDYGRELRFGYFLVPDAGAPLLATAREVERRGLDYVAVQDHPYQRRFVDTWTLLSMVAAVTERVGILPDVANLPLRPPAVLAKAAASLDVLCGGRVELGLGAGGFWDAIEAYGGPRRAPGDALAALAEGIEVIRKVWSGERNLRFEGRHYRLAGAQSGPVPAHPIGIWLGVYGPRALALTGRVADGWVPSFRGDLAEITAMSGALDEAARRAGRHPAAIRRILNVGGLITEGPAEGVLRGPVSRWVEELSELALGPGFDTFILWAEGERQLERFAEEVVPAVRERVAAERARRGAAAPGPGGEPAGAGPAVAAPVGAGPAVAGPAVSERVGAEPAGGGGGGAEVSPAVPAAAP
jgi:alkanesulfonate monooxygenase SsuD/methylene tetrahydromethanopterin reductase-like flavin-dependent oxidoreductase (luciferase family)